VLYEHDGRRLAAVTSISCGVWRCYVGAMVGDAIGMLAPAAAKPR
jgi:hypothetical protein